MHGNDIKRFFDVNYPRELAYDWDNVGLQIGTLNKEITGVLLTLDVTKEILEEAIKKKANLIIAHHPLVFKPLNNVLTDSYKGNLIAQLIKNDIAVYVSHTNFDLGDDGMNTLLAKRLGLKNTAILEYETATHGIGKIGTIEPLPLDETIKTIKTRLSMRHARLITKKPANTTVKTIAISGGSGAQHMFEAKKKGADLYITGDVSYHQAHDMLQVGLTALDIGHYVEKHFMHGLKQQLTAFGIDCPLYESAVDQDPFQYV